MSGATQKDDLRELLKSLLEPEARSCFEGEAIDPAILEQATSAILEAVDSAQIEPSVEVATDGLQDRSLKLSAHGGKLHGKSVKLKNLTLNRSKLVEFATHSLVLGGHTLEGKESPSYTMSFLGILGLLLLARCAAEAFSIELTEQDASTCFGLIKALGTAASASEADVVEVTNQAREAFNLGPIGALAIHRSLENLRSLKVVDRPPGKPDHWMMIETFSMA
ncbi:hypothetical protein ACYOEI_28425 [Singulisphaera rosea]